MQLYPDWLHRYVIIKFFLSTPIKLCLTRLTHGRREAKFFHVGPCISEVVDMGFTYVRMLEFYVDIRCKLRGLSH